MKIFGEKIFWTFCIFQFENANFALKSVYQKFWRWNTYWAPWEGKNVSIILKPQFMRRLVSFDQILDVKQITAIHVIITDVLWNSSLQFFLVWALQLRKYHFRAKVWGECLYLLNSLRKIIKTQTARKLIRGKLLKNLHRILSRLRINLRWFR